MTTYKAQIQVKLRQPPSNNTLNLDRERKNSKIAHTVNINIQHHPAKSVNPSDTSTGKFKRCEITQSLDTGVEKSDSCKKKERKTQTAKSSGGLTVDYTKTRDVFRLLIEQVVFEKT